MHVVITGGSSGIGAAIAAIEVRRGNAVSLIARNGDRLAATRDHLAAHHPGCRVSIAIADIRDAAAIAEAIRLCENELGPCDRLVASAGTVRPGRVEDQPDGDYFGQIETNLFGTMHTVRAVLPAMIARGAGQIVVISSAGGLVGVHGISAYSAAKHALVGFCEALRQEVAARGVAVSIAYPPDTLTPLFEEEIKARSPETEAIAGLVKPLTPEHVAAAIVSGADRGRFEIHIGLQTALLSRFGRLIAPLLRVFFDHRIASAAKRSRCEGATPRD